MAESLERREACAAFVPQEPRVHASRRCLRWRWASAPIRPSSPWSTRCCLSRLAIRDADRIVQFFNVIGPDGTGPCRVRFPTSTSGSSRPVSFREVAAYDFGGPGFNITGDRPEQVHGHARDRGLFPPVWRAGYAGAYVYAAGRLAERRQGRGAQLRALAAQVRRQSKRHRQALSLGNEPYTIIGVLGQRFQYRSRCRHLAAVPVRARTAPTRAITFWLPAMLKPGVTLAQANAQMKLAHEPVPPHLS